MDKVSSELPEPGSWTRTATTSFLLALTCKTSTQIILDKMKLPYLRLKNYRFEGALVHVKSTILGVARLSDILFRHGIQKHQQCQ